jgi:hypothetical protein
VWQVKDLAESGLGRTGSTVAVADEHALRSELGRLASLGPRAVGIELSGNEYLQLGLGGPWAFVEHVVDEPWKAEVALPHPEARKRPESVWFVCGGQGSEIPSQYLMPAAEAIEVVVQCLRLGGVSPGWRWELI